MVKLGFAPFLEQVDGHPQGHDDDGPGVLIAAGAVDQLHVGLQGETAQLVSLVGRFRIGGGERQDLRRAG